MPPPPGIALPP
jgi:hypothetical protein